MCYQALKTSILGPLDEKSEGQRKKLRRDRPIYTTTLLPCSLAHASAHMRLRAHLVMRRDRGRVNKRRSDPPTSPPRSPYFTRRRANGLRSGPSAAAGERGRATSYSCRRAKWATWCQDMAGQPPPQGPEDDFFDQFFSMTAGGSYPGATAGGGRAPGDQPFSLALSLDAAAAEASGSGKHADGGKAVSALPSCPLSPLLRFSPLHLLHLPNDRVPECCMLSSLLASAGPGGYTAPWALPAGVRRRCAATPPPRHPAYPGTVHAAARV